MSATHPLGEKRRRWFDNEFWGYKVGVVTYERGVIVHPPSALGGMTVTRFDDPGVAAAYARLVQRGFESLHADLEGQSRVDNVAVREVCPVL